MLNKFKKNNNKGFTLVELLVVIAIIGILAVVAVPSLFKNIDKSKAVQVTTNINAIKTEIMSNYADGITYADMVDASKDYKKAILNIVPETEIKAGESYDITALENNAGIAITVKTEAGDSNVLGRVAKQFGEQIDDTATNSVTIDVTN